MSGSSAGCGPSTLVMARQAQISSLHAGGLGAEPPTPMAPIIWLPLMTIGRPPELAKLPNEYCRSSDERPDSTWFITALLGWRVLTTVRAFIIAVSIDLRLAVHAVHIDRLAELV